MAVENIVKQNDAVPATIAVLDGEIHIGMYSHVCANYGNNIDLVVFVYLRHHNYGVLYFFRFIGKGTDKFSEKEAAYHESFTT